MRYLVAMDVHLTLKLKFYREIPRKKVSKNTKKNIKNLLQKQG